MRRFWIPAAVVVLLLAPQPTTATAVPVLTWPADGFQYPDAAANLTAWFADRLGEEADTSRAPGWEPANGTHGPDFANASRRYVLPLLGGFAFALYSKTDYLRHVGLVANTTYRAASTNDPDLVAVGREVASALGIDVSRAPGGINVVIPVEDGEPRFENATWYVGFSEETVFGHALNSLEVSIRGPDLRVFSVGASPWYVVSGEPDVDESEAVAIAVDFADLNFGARNASGDSSSMEVRDGLSFVYIIVVQWPSDDDPYCSWMANVWVDATSSEVLYSEGVYYACEDTGQDPGGWLPPWIWIVIPLSALFVALTLWFRLSAERALDQFTRGQIYGFVVANPGARYVQIRESLHLPNGATAYHLQVLERTGFLRSHREGRARAVYPVGAPFRHGSLILSRLQHAILDILHAEGPMAQTDIARRLGLSKQRAHYNVKVLRKLGLVTPNPGGLVTLSQAGRQALPMDSGPVSETSQTSGSTVL